MEILERGRKIPAAVGHHYVDHHLPLCQWVRRRRHFWDCVVDSALGWCSLMLVDADRPEKENKSHSVDGK